MQGSTFLLFSVGPQVTETIPTFLLASCVSVSIPIYREIPFPFRVVAVCERDSNFQLKEVVYLLENINSQFYLLFLKSMLTTNDIHV